MDQRVIQAMELLREAGASTCWWHPSPAGIVQCGERGGGMLTTPRELSAAGAAGEEGGRREGRGRELRRAYGVDKWWQFEAAAPLRGEAASRHN
ncbi:hypothetical protein NDU88_004909 [Pleurodeles waltl]|uniref:Uncharacterized protein n=1 Tax=Pleurodeles waltl TaxID=8319 RepID=A0AAV7T994_PLEWA|nr:hypothetical protein NDU88_004909 [Pleurodeles waltl]